MSAIDITVARLMSEEGFMAQMYPDSRGFRTIGYGFNIDAGITQFAAKALLVAQATEKSQALFAAFPWVQSMDDARQSVLMDMCFNMGLAKLSQFHDLLAACQSGNWQAARAAMISSAWHGQVGIRATKLEAIMLTGDPNAS